LLPVERYPRGSSGLSRDALGLLGIPLLFESLEGLAGLGFVSTVRKTNRYAGSIFREAEWSCTPLLAQLLPFSLLIKKKILFLNIYLNFLFSKLK
jgi:hypothetical protein